jgi:acyl-CoA reductase-like NAD-dependent aldehyde dehydrogenase
MFEVTDLDRITAQTLGDEPYRLLIGGEWCQSASGAQFGVYNPATGQLLTQVPDAGSAETQAAIEAAYAALPEWSRLACA